MCVCTDKWRYIMTYRKSHKPFCYFGCKHCATCTYKKVQRTASGYKVDCSLGRVRKFFLEDFINKIFKK